MIARVVRGWDVGGLVRYLFGPGRAYEHEQPRVVATWDQRPDRWQPERTGEGEFDLDAASLREALQAPLRAAGYPRRAPNEDAAEYRRFSRRDRATGQRVLQEGPVWHCSVRNHRDDRTLSDADWAHIAEELMHQSGVAPRQDAGGVRWAAVRHDDDGIHLVATLVRQDTGAPARAAHWKHKLRSACQQMEQVYGVTVTGGADRTAAPAETRAEREKATRTGQSEPSRMRLRRSVAQAAATSVSWQAFAQALQQHGVQLRERRLPSGELRGYSVRLSGDVDRRGDPVWFSGSKLAADLSLPQLERRWDQARHGGTAAGAVPARAASAEWTRYGSQVVARAQRALRDDPASVHGIAHAVGEVWCAIDGARGRLNGPGASWDRVGRQPHRVVPARTPRVADELRWLARGLAHSRTSSAAALRLGLAVAALAAQVAEVLREQRCPVVQVRQAQRTATAFERLAVRSGVQPPATSVTATRMPRGATPPQRLGRPPDHGQGPARGLER